MNLEGTREPADAEASGRAAGADRSPQRALVSFGALRWLLAEGESLTVGRQSDRTIRIGAEDPGPEDRGVSRRAATITYAQGQVWVTNDSTTQPVKVRTPGRREAVLDHYRQTVSMPDARIDVLIEGQVLVYRVAVEAVSTLTDSDDQPTVSPPTESRLPLSEREKRILAALCRPILRPAGEARPATYNEMSVELGISASSIRKGLDELRARLADRGIPGMVGEEAKDHLAWYAVDSGSVSADDIAPATREAT